MVCVLTHKHLETYVCVLSTVLTDATGLKKIKHQATSIHSAVWTFIPFD